MQEIKLWLWIFWETIRPTDYSWVVIAAPLVIAGIVLFAVLRNKTYPDAGAWREAGRRWQALGWVILGTALVCGIVVPLASNKFKDLYAARLSRGAIKFRIVDIKTQVRSLATQLNNRDEAELVDYILSFAKELQPEEREGLQQAIISRLDLTIQNPYQTLDPDYLRTMDVRNPRIDHYDSKAIQGLVYSPEQKSLYDSKQYDRLHLILETNQWYHIVDFSLEAVDADARANMIATACDTTTHGREIRDALLNRVFGPGNYSRRLAWELQFYGINVHTIHVLIKYSPWIRELFWSLVWCIVGMLILARGATMIRQGKPDPFNVGSKAAAV